MNNQSASKLGETTIYYGAVQKMKELTACIQLIKDRLILERVLEIGTAIGGTFWLWCQLASDKGKIISLDLPMSVFNNGQAYNKKVLTSYGRPEQKLSFIRKNSHTDKAEGLLKKILENQFIDLLFIDGDHTYEGVKEDYSRYNKYVRKGGIIIFHDIVVHDQILDCQVYKYWNELKVGKEYYEFIDSEYDDRGWGSWGGIGVIIKE